MWHSGMDVHSRLTAFHLLDGAGVTQRTGTFATTEEEIVAFCLELPKTTHLYVEASTSSAWFARLVDGCGHRVTVVDPNRIRAIARSPKKTDASDAATLAALGRAGLLSPVYVRSERTDRFRQVIGARQALVRSRGNLIRVARAFMRAEGLVLPTCDGDDFALRLETLWKIPDAQRQAVEPLARVIEEMTAQIAETEKSIEAVAEAHEPMVKQLTGIPGVGRLVATSYMALIEDPGRFSNAGEVSAYLGLAPWVNESAGKRKEAGITKRGHSATRVLLVQAAWSHVRSHMDTALKQWFRKLAVRIGQKKAITALARKLGELMWMLLRTGARYQPYPPSSRRSPSPA